MENIDIKMSPFSGGLLWISDAENTPSTNSKLNSPENSLIYARGGAGRAVRLTAEGLQSDGRYTSADPLPSGTGFGYHHIRNDLISKGVVLSGRSDAPSR